MRVRNLLKTMNPAHVFAGKALVVERQDESVGLRAVRDEKLWRFLAGPEYQVEYRNLHDDACDARLVSDDPATRITM